MLVYTVIIEEGKGQIEHEKFYEVNIIIHTNA